MRENIKREKMEKIKEHIENFPVPYVNTYYTEDAVDYLHRNPGLTPGLFCLGSPSYSYSYRQFGIQKWLGELMTILGIEVKKELKERVDYAKKVKGEEMNMEQKLSRRFGKK